MVYLAELLVVMTDQLEIVRIRARNVLRVNGRTQALRQRGISHISLSLHESNGVASRADALGRCPVEAQTKSSPDKLRMSGSGF